MKQYIKTFWFSNINRKFSIQEYEDVHFELKYEGLKVGILSFSDGFWLFEYTDDFKMQSEICPLVNFPQKEKSYRSNELWPFFTSRIPSNAQLMISEKQKEDDIVFLLSKYGKKSITNPFELQAAF